MDQLNFREFVEMEHAGAAQQEYTDMDVVNMYSRFYNKLRVQDIAEITGRSVGAIYRILRDHHHEPNRLKTNHHNVTMFADMGFNPEQIGQLTNYTGRNVRYILKNRMTENDNHS